MSPLTGDRELEATLSSGGGCREPEFTRGVDREAVLGSAGGLLTLPFGIAQGTKLRPVIHSRSRPATGATSPYSVETWRTWEYWANKAGCGHLLTRPDGGHAQPPKG